MRHGSLLAALSLATGTGAQGKVAGVNAVGQGLAMVVLGPIVGTALLQKSPLAPSLGGAVMIAGVCVMAAIVAMAMGRQKAMERR